MKCERSSLTSPAWAMSSKRAKSIGFDAIAGDTIGFLISFSDGSAGIYTAVPEGQAPGHRTAAEALVQVELESLTVRVVA